MDRPHHPQEILKKYLSTTTSDKVQDVHSDPQYFQKGIDLVLHHPNNTTTTIDLKVDSYPNRKIRGLCNPDSSYILLETISQLQFDRERHVDNSGTPGPATGPTPQAGSRCQAIQTSTDGSAPARPRFYSVLGKADLYRGHLYSSMPYAVYLSTRETVLGLGGRSGSFQGD